MTVMELIERLQEFDPEAEVRIAHQPSYPLESACGEIAEVHFDEPSDFCEDHETMRSRCECEPSEPEGEGRVVYIGEGRQLGYLPGLAASELGWR